jgi:hypothetical protein
MSLLGRVLTMGTFVFLVIPSVPVYSQYGGAALGMLNSDDAGIVLGQPCFAILRITDVPPDGNGARATTIKEERKWRDSKGRFRLETARVTEGQDPVFQVVTILDPVKNTITTLNLEQKTASIVDLQPGQLHAWADRDAKPLLAMPGVDVKVEHLPGKTIDGVFALGRRVTRTRPPGTVGNDKTIVSVSESWVAEDLKILLASSMDDPRTGKETGEVTRLERTEPDAGLFQVPAGYTVNEAQGKPLYPVIRSGHPQN